MLQYVLVLTSYKKDTAFFVPMYMYRVSVVSYAMADMHKGEGLKEARGVLVVRYVTGTFWICLT